MGGAAGQKVASRSVTLVDVLLSNRTPRSHRLPVSKTPWKRSSSLHSSPDRDATRLLRTLDPMARTTSKFELLIRFVVRIDIDRTLRFANSQRSSCDSDFGIKSGSVGTRALRRLCAFHSHHGERVGTQR
jgi:hypothetical protein